MGFLQKTSSSCPLACHLGLHDHVRRRVVVRLHGYLKPDKANELAEGIATHLRQWRVLRRARLVWDVETPPCQTEVASIPGRRGKDGFASLDVSAPPVIQVWERGLETKFVP